jgi:hypothetical protein
MQEAIELIKHIQIIIILAICLLVLTISANAATYYVDLTGSDLNDGSSGSPFATIQKGVDAASAGDTVHVNAGTYYERINISSSGSPGKPITIEGSLGAGNTRLSAVDGSTAITEWASAPEVGTGVYKNTSAPFEPGSMYVVENGVEKDIPRCSKSDWGTTIATASNATVKTHYLGITIDWWDGIEAMFRPSGSTLYVRFRDNSNPNSKTIRVSQDNDACFDFSNSTYVILKNFKIRGCYEGINLTGSGTNNITIDNNEIYATGRSKISMKNGAHTIEVKNNKTYMSILGNYHPGAWSGGRTYTHGVREWIYYCYKMYLSASSTSSDEEDGIRANNVGPGITIHDNEIFDGTQAINVGGTSDEVEIYNNTIYQFSSTGISNVRASNTKVHDNLMYDINIIHRLQYCEYTDNGRHTFFYNNRSYNPDGVGDHTYFHFGTSSSSPSEFADFWFYHNSFAGGRRVFVPSGYADENGGLQNTYFINNVFTGDSIYGNSIGLYEGDSSMVEIFDYNWLGGFYPYNGNLPAWSGPDNINAEGQTVWSHSSMPDFKLPAGHVARNAGIDVSKNFSIRGKTYQPLPGMNPGYYTTVSPDLGIFNATPIIPQNLRIGSHIP